MKKYILCVLLSVLILQSLIPFAFAIDEQVTTTEKEKDFELSIKALLPYQNKSFEDSSEYTSSSLEENLPSADTPTTLVENIQESRSNTLSITVINGEPNHMYALYKLFNIERDGDRCNYSASSYSYVAAGTTEDKNADSFISITADLIKIRDEGTNMWPFLRRIYNRMKSVNEKGIANGTEQEYAVQVHYTGPDENTVSFTDIEDGYYIIADVTVSDTIGCYSIYAFDSTALQLGGSYDVKLKKRSLPETSSRVRSGVIGNADDILINDWSSYATFYLGQSLEQIIAIKVPRGLNEDYTYYNIVINETWKEYLELDGDVTVGYYYEDGIDVPVAEMKWMLDIVDNEESLSNYCTVTTKKSGFSVNFHNFLDIKSDGLYADNMIILIHYNLKAITSVVLPEPEVAGNVVIEDVYNTTECNYRTNFDEKDSSISNRYNWVLAPITWAFTKYNEYNEELSNANFKLTFWDSNNSSWIDIESIGGHYTRKSTMWEWGTERTPNAKHVFTGLSAGNYLLTETIAPEHYSGSPPICFRITRKGWELTFEWLTDYVYSKNDIVNPEEYDGELITIGLSKIVEKKNNSEDDYYDDYYGDSLDKNGFTGKLDYLQPSGPAFGYLMTSTASAYRGKTTEVTLTDVKFLNYPGMHLPRTGGFNFYGVAGVGFIIVACGVWIIIKRKSTPATIDI